VVTAWSWRWRARQRDTAVSETINQLVGAGALATVLCAVIGPGLERMHVALARLRRAVTAQFPGTACAAVMGALVGSEPARDDIALLMIRRQVTGEDDAHA
jgi:hypothetical protein